MTNILNKDIIKLILNAFEYFIGTGLYFLLFGISILFVLFNKKVSKKVKIVFGFFSIIVLIMNFNPIFAKIYVKIQGDTTYWRVYWMFPFAISIAYMFTYIIFSARGKVNKAILIFIICALIIESGNFVYTSDNFQKVNNYYKIDDEVFDIVNYVSNDNCDYKKLAGPEDFEVYTRQIDGTIFLTTGRVWGVPTKGNIVYSINNADYKAIYDISVKTNTNYIVMENKNIKEDDNLKNYEFDEIYKNEKYTLYFKK